MAFTYVEPRPVPDTGQTTCYNDSRGNSLSDVQGPPFTARTPSTAVIPRSYTKLDCGNGNDLPGYGRVLGHGSATTSPA